MMSRDPLDILPYEIWLKSMCFAVYGEPNGPLPMLRVSSRWERNIIDSPDMWTSITIDDRDQDLLARVTTFLHLSANLPIDIHLVIHRLNHDTVNLVLAHSHRIRAFIMYPPISGYEREGVYLEYVDRLLTKDDQTFPELEEITITGSTVPRSGVYILPTRCPKLRFLNGSVVGLRHLQDFAPNLIEFDVLLTVGDRMSDLNHRFPIRSLVVVDLTALVPTEQPLPAVRLPNLDNLTLVQTRISTLKALLQPEACPRLRSLSLRIKPSLIISSLQSLHLFPELRSLRLTFVSEEEKGVSSDPTIFESPPLSTFEIHGNGKTISAAQLQRVLDVLADSNALSYVNNLSFGAHNWEQLSSIMVALQAAQRVQFLRILYESNSIDYPRQSHAELSITIPSLRVLKLTRVELLRHIRTPNLEELELLHTPSSSHPSDSDIFRINYDILTARRRGEPLFLAMQRMKWSEWGMGPALQTTLLSSITTVEFAAGFTTETNPMNIVSIDAFCINLLRYPNACPVLETIISAEYPCWDLLFYALSTRNANIRIKSITTVGFPDLPVITILQPLVAVLDQCDVRRPGTPIDEVIQKRLSVPGVSTCYKCIAAGYSRCLPKRAPNLSNPRTNQRATSTNADVNEDGKLIWEAAEFVLGSEPAEVEDSNGNPNSNSYPQKRANSQVQNWKWWTDFVRASLDVKLGPVRLIHRNCARHSSRPLINCYTLS